MTFKKNIKKIKNAGFRMASLDEKLRNNALHEINKALVHDKEKIFAANAIDIEAGKALSQPMRSRLLFDEHKLADVTTGIETLIELPDPLNKTLMERTIANDLTLKKTTCPIGVIGVIFEARPDALIQISALCIKSGNCAILKGGSESKESNKTIFNIIYNAGLKAGLPKDFATLIESRENVDKLLDCHDYIDLIIPRGSNEFVQYIMDNTKIPVMGHSDGICSIYVDEDADIGMAAKIIADAKTQYVSACNAAEMLLVHDSIDLNFLKSKILENSPVNICFNDNGEYIEYLDYTISIRTVSGVDEAISLINKNGSHHTDSIITENKISAAKFMDSVDSAGVFWNASTRFADGFRYGFGAEVGISTGKLHARGPVGLDGLVTYKYQLKGNGHIVGDFASGVCCFDFKDIK